MPKCRTCSHPERERIEFDLANCIQGQHGAMLGIANKYGIPRSSLQRHLTRHMATAQVARLRYNVPDATDQRIEEVVRREGENAIIGLRALKEQHLLAIDRLDNANDTAGARAERKELRAVYEAHAKYGGKIPGRKSVTNNNLVLGDVSTLFELIDATLKPFPEARRAVADAFSRSQDALEHKPNE